jgi:hypothetical protein
MLKAQLRYDVAVAPRVSAMASSRCTLDIFEGLSDHWHYSHIFFRHLILSLSIISPFRNESAGFPS